jgi:hypothetical protein
MREIEGRAVKCSSERVWEMSEFQNIRDVDLGKLAAEMLFCSGAL